MSPSEPLFLHALVPGAIPYEIGDEIWQQSLADAMEAEAEAIADDAGADELEDSGEASRKQLRDEVIADMTAALTPHRRHLPRARRHPLRAHPLPGRPLNQRTRIGGPYERPRPTHLSSTSREAFTVARGWSGGDQGLRGR